MHRFFVPPEAFGRQPVVLVGDQAHQIRRVLRLRLGDRVTLLDGQGAAYEGMLVALGENDARFQLVQQSQSRGEPGVHVTLYQAVLKGERFSWTLQKGTELGVSRFVPVVCERNVVDDLKVVEGKRERWERIIQEAAEQSGRLMLPDLAPAQLFSMAIQDQRYPAAIGVIAWEEERMQRFSEVLSTCNFVEGSRIKVYVGPEGGFTAAEIDLALSYGVQPVTLGRRTLRAETVGLVIATAILYHSGEL